MHKAYKTAILWVFIVGIFVAAWCIADRPRGERLQLLQTDLQVGRVTALRLHPDRDRASAEVQLRGGRTYVTEQVSFVELVEAAQAAHVPYVIESDRSPSLLTLAVTWIPALLLTVLVFFTVRALRKGPKGADAATREWIEARIEARPPPERPRLEGLTAAREQLIAAAAALRRGEPGPRRILLSGPPGSGKTVLLRWLAAEAELKLVAIPGSDLGNLWVGIAAARIRRFFEVAGAHAPCLAAIEDVDAFALRRPGPAEPSSREQGRTESEHALLELCHHLDGVRGLPPGVLFVATTNRPDRLDEAFTRPGRIDLHLALALDGGAEVVAHEAPRATG